MMSFFIIFVFFGVSTLMFLRYQKHIKAKKIYGRAFEIELKNYNSSCNIDELNYALVLYKQCNKLVRKSYYSEAVKSCQQRISNHQKFHAFIATARKQVKQKRFKEALANFSKANAICFVDNLEAEIIKCQENISQQNNYEQALSQSFKMAQEGQFKQAIAILEPEQAKFDRDDGYEFLAQLRRICSAKDCYRLGLLDEKNGTIESAIQQYKQALQILPELTECQIRLAILSIKTNDPNQAIFYLKGINDIQSNYLRGFAYTQLDEWQQASREWDSISKVGVDNQRSIVEEIIKHDRLIKIQAIEKLIDQQQIELAKSLSFDFINKYDLNSIVKHNLENHINPVLEHQLWAKNDWEKIATETEQIWLEQQNIKSLHNWAIATYYQAQVNPNKLKIFIIAWSTALANINLDSSLKDAPWLGGNSIDLQDISYRLKQIIENAIDDVKDENMEEYLKLRDIYRRDMVMLSLSQKSNCGIKTKSQLIILPNYYQHFRNFKNFEQYLLSMNLPIEIWGALYTDWGMAIAACYERDIERAIKIKPHQNPTSEIENFAHAFISYHEGCYYLENKYWRKAIKLFLEVKLEIIIKSDWCNEIDRLCNIQRQQIKEIDEHLEFSKSWYLLISSQGSKAYYVEYQSMQVGLDVDNKKIDVQQALNKLRKLQQIDPYNTVNSDIIATLEINFALEQINILWQESQYEEAVAFARRSQHQKVHFAVAEVCLEIVLEILQHSDLNSESIKSLQKVTQWAYELCPHEPLFQPTYSQLKQLGIHH